LIGDLILGRENRWSELYDAKRFTPAKSIQEWVSESVSVAKHLAKDYLKPSDTKTLEEVMPGEGKLVSLDGDKLAVYRNETGQVSVLSAVCPHMKCLVHWNAADHSWDCPCHGSRFDTNGAVIEGPALHGLAQRTELD